MLNTRSSGSGEVRPSIAGWAVMAVAMGLCSTLLPAAARAQEDETVRQEFTDTVHVVQPKPVLQKGRFELVPRIGMSVNDPINQSIKVGVNANYHLAEAFYIGGLFEWYNFGDTLGGPSQAYEEVVNLTNTSPDAARINYLAGLEVGFVPIWGKFALFDSAIIFYDIAVTAGGVFIDAESVALPSASSTGGGTLSLTSRVFLNDWFALNLEVRDVVFLADLAGTSGAFTNVVTTGIGMSFYLPTSFEYTERVVEAGGI